MRPIEQQMQLFWLNWGMECVDLCILGAGPAGLSAALKAADLGKSVVLVEEHKLGGYGLRRGALSSKTWWELAKQYHEAKQTAFQLDVSLPAPSLSLFRANVDKSMKAIEAQWEKVIRKINSEGKGSIQVMQGRGRLLGTGSVEVSNPKGTVCIEAANVLLATGSRPRCIPEIPCDGAFIHNSDSIENLQLLPKTLVIFGAGIVGCEYATIFGLLGQTQVTLVEKGSRILPFEDEDLSAEVTRQFESIGIRILTHAQPDWAHVVDGMVNFQISFQGSTPWTGQADMALLALGKVPNTEDVGIGTCDVACSPRGHVICLGSETRTNVPGIHAAGDLTADLALVNIAEMEGRHAVESMFGSGMPPLSYEDISTIMFLHPEVAGVGLNEQEAQKKQVPYRCVKLNYAGISRAVAMQKTSGFMKILACPETDKILGMRAVGEHASSLVQTIALMIKQNLPFSALKDVAHPHPSVVEGLQTCARVLNGEWVRSSEEVSRKEWRP
jgi:dihydrolipoamide dehydrogenase